MLKNYLKIAWRNLVRHKSSSVINILGLALGMACCVLISMYIREELSYDDFHEGAERIVLLGKVDKDYGRFLQTPYKLAEQLPKEVPEVEGTAIVDWKDGISMRVTRDKQNYQGISKVIKANEGFFDVFSFKLIRRTEDQVLDEAGEVVLTPKVGKRLFENEDPLGEIFYWKDRDTLIKMRVSGIVEEPPGNTVLSYNMIVSAETKRHISGLRYRGGKTFVKLDQKQKIDDLPGKAEAILGNIPIDTDITQVYTVPLTSLHLSDYHNTAGFTGNATYIYIFGSIALFILVIALINYINLTTAYAAKRMKEVGIRKSSGAGRFQLITQFLGETVLLSVLSFILALLMVELSMPGFNKVFGTRLSWAGNVDFILYLLVAAIAIGLLTGLYPAFYLSGFSPSTVLRWDQARGQSQGWTRKGLVIAQFGIAIALITCTLVIYQQLRFTQTKDLGFNPEGVAAVKFPGQNAWNLRTIIYQDIVNLEGIKQAALAENFPGNGYGGMGASPDASPIKPEVNVNQRITIRSSGVDTNYFDLMDVDIVAGRNFNASDLDRGVPRYIINEKLAELMGKEPGEVLGPMQWRDEEGKIIGVVENYHISSFRNEIPPLFLSYATDERWGEGWILLKTQQGKSQAVMDSIESIMAQHAPVKNLNVQYLDQKYRAMYRTERTFARIIGFFTLIAVLLACMGLYGLAVYTAQRRTKEIGIRKVLGASLTNILWLLNKDFLKWILVGFLLAAPAAWYLMHQWLERFAYKIEIGFSLLAMAGFIVFLVALITVSWQSLQAALTNPAESIRNE